MRHQHEQVCADQVMVNKPDSFIESTPPQYLLARIAQAMENGSKVGGLSTITTPPITFCRAVLRRTTVVLSLTRSSKAR